MFWKLTPERHWSVSASRKELQKIAANAVLEKPSNLSPPITMKPAALINGCFVPGAFPLVHLHSHRFSSLINAFLTKDFRVGMHSDKFSRCLKEKLDLFNQEVGLPPTGSCSLFNGYARGGALYTRGQYGFIAGDFKFHYQIDPRTFVCIVAHELTHLEQDYLFVCLLADFLGIGISATDTQISDLLALIKQNRAVDSTNEKVLRFLSHRHGRTLTDQQRARAEMLLQDFRTAPYLELLSRDAKKARKLIPKLRFYQSLDYAKFWNEICSNSDILPDGLKVRFDEANDFLTHHGKSGDSALIGKRFYRLLRYYADDTGTLISALHSLFERFMYFEREAYAIGRQFGN